MAVRILNVAQTYYPKLAERGHDVTVLTANLGTAEWSRIGLPIEKTTLGWRLTEGGVIAIYLPTWFRYRTLTINPGVLRFCGAALGKFDLVHFYGLYDLLGPSVSY